MGRDRDPFHRSYETLRRRLTDRPGAAVGPLAVLPLAAALGVSPTPVREALAHLSGEGLVAHGTSGYAGVVHDRASLADLYELAAVLVVAAIEAGLAPISISVASAELDALDQLAQRASNRALGAAIARVLAQLAPFAAAEIHVLGEAGRTGLAALLSEGAASPLLTRAVRAYFRRRARRSGDILVSALGL